MHKTLTLRRPSPFKVFQQFDIDYIVEFQKDEESAVLRMFGVNDDGNSIAVFIRGFQSYFYIEAPSPDFGPDECDQLCQELDVGCPSHRASAGGYFWPPWSFNRGGNGEGRGLRTGT